MQNQTKLSSRWQNLDNRKSSLKERCEQYARWTLPSLFTDDDRTHNESREEERSNVAIGARLVSHLAHRIGDTMFPNDTPFFTAQLPNEAVKAIMQEDAGPQKVQQFKEALHEIENVAMQKFDLTAYRPVAVEALSLNIVTGNSLIYRMPDGTRTVYSIRDYCIVRDVSGKAVEIILRDEKRFESLTSEQQARVRQHKPDLADRGHNTFTPKDSLELYTHFKWDGGRWQQRQAVNDVEFPEMSTFYNEQDFPCLPLVWNLHRGDSYGRGLVEEHAVSFHNIDILTEALLRMVGIAANVKFLVRSNGTLDIEELVNSEPGAYLPGEDGDISATSFKFPLEMQQIDTYIQKLERELAQAFLLSSAGIRTAERVTAEEIRFYAREVESAFGGLYSRLALEWQKKEAEYQVSQLNVQKYLPGGVEAYEISVVTGLESLSREGKLDNLREAIADMQMLEAVPEVIRGTIDPMRFAQFIFKNRNVPYDDILKTPEQIQAEQQAAIEQQQALAEQQGAVDVATQAATAELNRGT